MAHYLRDHEVRDSSVYRDMGVPTTSPRLDLIFSPYSIYPDHVKHSHACLHIVYVLVNVYLAGI
jgi:hypothetical protein